MTQGLSGCPASSSLKYRNFKAQIQYLHLFAVWESDELENVIDLLNKKTEKLLKKNAVISRG